MNGPTVFGRTWRKAIRRCRTPSARAASTYCISRMDSTLDRITRAARGMIGIEIAITTLWMAGPSAADITSASTSSGKPLFPGEAGEHGPRARTRPGEPRDGDLRGPNRHSAPAGLRRLGNVDERVSRGPREEPTGAYAVVREDRRGSAKP